MRPFRPPRLRLDSLEGVARRLGPNGWIVADKNSESYDFFCEYDDDSAHWSEAFVRLARTMPHDRLKDAVPQPERGRWPDIE